MSFAVYQTEALLIGKVMCIGVILIPPLFLHFVFSFLEIKKRRIILLSYLPAVIFLAGLPSKLFVDITYRPDIRFTVSPGAMYHFFLGYFIFLAGLSLYELYRAYTISTGVRRNQLKYMFWGTLIGFITGGSNFLYVYDRAVPLINPYATFGVPLYAIIIAYAMGKHRLMDINLIIRKTVIYGIIYSLSLAIFSIIVILIGQWVISGSIDKRVISLYIFAVCIVVVIVKPLDEFLTRHTNRFLFRGEYEYHCTLKKASLGMIRIRRLDKLLYLIVKIITRQVKVRHAAIFLWDKDENAYIVKAARGKPKIPKDQMKIISRNQLIRYLIRNKDSIVCEELKLALKQKPSDTLEAVIKEMNRLNVSVCVPSFLKDRLTGFLLLGEKLSGDMYSREDLSLFNTLSVQATLAIENAQAYEEITKAKEKLFEAEKFASIGRLAGGIAHEIKNPLASIKTFTTYLDKKFDDPGFREKFQRIVGSEVDRINHIVEQLVTYAHPKRLVTEIVRLHKIIDETFSLLENELREKNIRVKKYYLPGNAEITADPKQLKQVFLNLFLNSIAAMKDNNGRIKELSVVIEKEKGNLRVRISDTGEGIAKEQIPSIFDPFFTTKENGSGLGLSIVKSIVENHNGKISVESELGKGTSFEITFTHKK